MGCRGYRPHRRYSAAQGAGARAAPRAAGACAPMGTGFTRVTVVAALTVAVVLSACSSDEPALNRRAFIARANKECASLQQASDEFAKAQDPEAEGAEAGGFVHLAAARLRALVRHIDALVPPDTMQDNV